MKRHLLFGGLGASLGWAVFSMTACGSDEFGLGGLPGQGGPNPDDGGLDPGAPGGPGEPPPEEELEEEFEAPAAVGRYLWAANPESHRVALIDAVSYEVQTFDAGLAPTYLAGVPPVGEASGGALVLSGLGAHATLFFLPPEGTPVSAETVAVHTLPVHSRANAWRVGPRSGFAVAWSDARAFEAADPSESFQDVTVIELDPTEPRATRLSVGPRPSQVFIDAAEERAYVVSEPGISVIHLGSARVERELFLPEQASRDVSFTPDGSLAFVRLEGESHVLVVDLESDARVTVSLPAPVTDLDISADGTRAVAVMRRPGAEEPPDGAAGANGGAGAPGVAPEPSRVAILPVATISSDPADFLLLELDGLFGSSVVSADGQSALLFTNGVPHRWLSIVDLNDGSHRELDLQAPVRAVLLTEDGSHAVALLAPPEGSARQGAFSLVPVRDAFPTKLQGTAAPPRFVSLSSDPRRALITTRGPEGGPHEVFLARFPDLRIDAVSLPSQPLSSGIVPDARKGFVAQAHAEGRVTFVGLDDGDSRVLTGFELGGKVVQ